MERLLFGAGLAVLLHPVLSSRFFHTVDGPSHLYNAGALTTLLFSGAEAVPWELNTLPVPNWTGHLLMAMLLHWLDPADTLKLIHVLCLAGLPFCTRLLVAQHGSVPWTAHLVLPFTLNAVFMLGFINFSLALPLVLVVMWYWKKIAGGAHGNWAIPVLALLLVALYFTHLLPFLFAVAWLGWQLITVHLFRSDGQGALPVSPLAIGPWPWLAMVPSLVLCAWYFMAGHEGVEGDHVAPDRLALFARPFLLSDRSGERWVFAGAWTLIAVAVFLGSPVPGLVRGLWHNASSVLFLLGAAMLFLMMPDQLGRGSDVLVRLSILLHVVVIAGLPAWGRSPMGGAALSVVCIGLVLAQGGLRNEDRRYQESRLRACTELATMVPKGSSVAIYPVDWWDAHLPKIGLAGRDIMLWSNYELLNPHFPLRWKAPQRDHMSNLPPDPLDTLMPRTLIGGALLRETDHILIIGWPRTEEGFQTIQWMLRELEHSHTTVARNEVCWLLGPSSSAVVGAMHENIGYPLGTMRPE